jgi:hypothetical protein
MFMRKKEKIKLPEHAVVVGNTDMEVKIIIFF